MRKIKFYILLVLFNVSYFNYGYSQAGLSAYNSDFSTLVNSQVADVSSIVSKNLNTGVVNVNIPLYDTKINNLDMAINLSYNTSGTYVDKFASEVGLGWELNAGPEIYRQVRGFPDEKAAGPDQLGIRGYWYDQTAYKFYHSEICDGEPDIFYFYFQNRLIKFMFSTQGECLQIPLSSLKIYRCMDGVPITNYGLLGNSPSGNFDKLTFKIIDEKGNTYYFQGVHGKTMFAWYPDFSEYEYTTDKWMIQKIITYEGQEIDYSYYDKHATHENYSNMQVTEERDPNYLVAISQIVSDTCWTIPLKSITYPNNVKVNFNWASQPRCDIDDMFNSHRLSSIDILENVAPASSTPIKYSYQFNQSYFKSPAYLYYFDANNYTSWTQTGAYDNFRPIDIESNCSQYDGRQLRLKLDGITINGFDGSSKNYYKFDYFPIPLPYRVLGGRDNFGYANGSWPYSFNTNSCGVYQLYVPQHNLGTGSTTVGMNTVPEMYPSPSAKGYILGDQLKTVTNENGGSITFTYKSLYAVTGNKLSGLAVSNIITSDGYSTDNDQIDSITYQNSEWYFSSIEGHSFYRTTPSLDFCTHTGDLNPWYQIENWFTILNTGLGKRFGFTQVSEDKYDRNKNLLGGTSYQYSGMSPNLLTDAHGFTSDNFYHQPSGISSSWINFGSAPFANKQFERDWGIGLLLNATEYDANRNTINSKNYAYTIIDHYITDNSWQHLAGSYLSQPAIINMSPNTWDTYYPFSGKALIKSVDERKVFSTSNYISNTTLYTYDTSQQRFNITKSTCNNSIGQTITTNFYYNYNWLGTTSPAITQLTTDNIQTLLYKDKWRSISSTSNLVELQAPGYSIVTGKIVRPTYLYNLNNSISTPVTSSFYADMNGMSAGSSVSNLYLKSRVSKFDNNGNSIEYTDDNGSKIHASIVDNDLNASLADALNAQYSEIAYCGFDSHYDFSATKDYRMGNWNFSASGITNSYTLTGRCSYHVSSSSNTGLYSTGNLQVGKKYIISYWMYSGGSIYVNDGINQIPNSANTTAFTNITHYGSWSLYKTTFVAKKPVIGIWGEGYVDEVKLYPADAVMSTSSYTPMIGKVADIDGADNVTIYEYDGFGNKTITRDCLGNIKSKVVTVKQGND